MWKNENVSDSEAETVVSIFNNLCNKFEKDLDIIFSTQAEQKRLLFRVSREKENNWKSSKNCIFCNCNNPSIVRSHTIQKSGSLDVVAEEGHVLTPKFNRTIGKLKVSEVGINYASTFPGFCEEHELLFSKFETKKDLGDSKDMSLQIYRTICREVVAKKIGIKHYKTLKDFYVKFRDSKFRELINIELTNHAIPEKFARIMSFDLKNIDSRQFFLDRKIRSEEKTLRKFEKNIYFPLSRQLLGTKNNALAYEGFMCDFRIPVCLAGIGNFSINTKKSGRKDVTAILNVLPYLDKTYIVIVTSVRHIAYLKWYSDNHLSNGLDVINAIESWMVYGTDHWFIQPSVWNKLPKVIKQEIENDLWDLDKNIGFRYKHTIFSDLKKQLTEENKLGQLLIK